MSHSIQFFIANHGYLAIFIIILSQELGVPIPFPNEFLLMFVGYLAFTGLFDFQTTAFTALAASMIGAWILFGLAYGFQELIMREGSKIPFPRALVHKISQKIYKGQFWAVFIGRIVPFGRGYICLAAGITKVRPPTFASAVIIADTIWNIGFVTVGFFAGPYWSLLAQKIGGVEHLLFVGFILFVVIAFLNYVYGKKSKIEAL